ncbi:hypothetical protein EDB84DRAFT_1675757 [Lactarius hengduanensis]|nr:hypothetical protein EDB84DRAFT_1675757 [Lactarius hengduanensis]
MKRGTSPEQPLTLNYYIPHLQITLIHISIMNPVHGLKNYLQGHPTGILTPLFSWEMRQDGPKHQVTHLATAKLRGVEIGHGKGLTMSTAKREAVTIALQRLKTTM